jgi:hypothetical protein
MHTYVNQCAHGDMCCDGARAGAWLDEECWAQWLLKVWFMYLQCGHTWEFVRNTESQNLQTQNWSAKEVPNSFVGA